MGVTYPDICLEVLKKTRELPVRIAVSDPTFEPCTSRIRSTNVTESTALFASRVVMLIHELIPWRRVSLAKPVLRRLRISPLFRNQKATAVFSKGSY